MHRRSLLALLLAPASLPSGAAAQSFSAQDLADLGRVETYLNALRTLKARFLQIAPDGATSEGNAWIERPGRMRFEYDPPTPLLLVAGAGSGMFYDRQLKQVSHFPLSSTPLGLLLADRLRLAGDASVIEVSRLPGQLHVTLIRAGAPQEGSLTLVFADNPISLRQWSVIDPQGRETRVSLFNVALGGTFDQKLFNTADPRLLE